MSSEILGDPETPYECRYCPKCEAVNWAASEQCLNIGSIPTDIIQCWKCQFEFWIDGYEIHPYEGEPDTLVCRGTPDPAIPVDYLMILLDTAIEQYKDLQMGVRSEEDDPSLIETIKEIEVAINFVKELLGDGSVKYTPPS